MQVNTLLKNLVFSTVRLETHLSDGRGKFGTAFAFTYALPESPGRATMFLVSNKHVIEDAVVGHFFFTQSEGSKHGTAPRIGQRFDVRVDNFAAQWTGHPDPNVDIAVMPLLPILDLIDQTGSRVFFRTIGDRLIPSAEQVSELDAIEEIVFIGYPTGLYDQKNLMPIIRRGITATHPQLDYEGQPVFLVDASVFPGSSGSPVLICNTGFYTTPSGVTVGNRIMFLGVLARVFTHADSGQIEIDPIPTSHKAVITTKQMINLGAVYKASTVVETIRECIRQRGTGLEFDEEDADS